MLKTIKLKKDIKHNSSHKIFMLPFCFFYYFLCVSISTSHSPFPRNHVAYVLAAVRAELPHHTPSIPTIVKSMSKSARAELENEPSSKIDRGDTCPGTGTILGHPLSIDAPLLTNILGLIGAGFAMGSWASISDRNSFLWARFLRSLRLIGAGSRLLF